MAKILPPNKWQQELIRELVKDYDSPEEFWGETGLFAQLKKRIIEATLNAEVDQHLGYSKHDPRAASPPLAGGQLGQQPQRLNPKNGRLRR